MVKNLAQHQKVTIIIGQGLEIQKESKQDKKLK